MWRLGGWLTGRSGAESFVKVGEVRPVYVYQSMLDRFFHFPPIDGDDEVDVAVAWWEEPPR